MLPLSCWRSMSGVRISGTRSRKYPVLGFPLTRTPTSRNRSTHRQTVERETPISLAIRSPLMAMVALLAKSVSREASRRSVLPEREVWAMEAARSLLVLDGVHKQAEIGGRRRVGQRARRKKIGSGFGICANIPQRNAAGNFHHALGPQAARQFDCALSFGGRHVVEKHR